MTRNAIAKLETFSMNISPYGFHTYAMDYMETAEKWTNEAEYSPVPYFLYCRAIELGLKAFLLAKGKNLAYIKNSVNHNLSVGLKNARQNSLDDIIETTEIEEEEIEKANKYYKTKGFEYFFVLNHMTGLKELPKLDVLQEYSKKLLVKIKPLTDN